MFAPKVTKRQTMAPTSSTNSTTRTAIIQPKLLIGQINDPFEQEADRVADAVVGPPVRELVVAAAPRQISRKCAACEEEEDEQLLRKPSDVAAPAPVEAPPVVHEVVRSPGHPLEAATRAYFEPRFRHDFTQIRVHTDPRAAASARAVQARAYTIGPDIVFGPGQYAPATQTGQRLLAHELTHVVQQERGRGASATRVFRQPDLTGSGLTLTSPEPRSLRKSLNVDALSLTDLDLEITLIQKWLNEHPRDHQSEHLRSELKRLQSGLQIKSLPFEMRFYNAWGQASDALKKEVYRRDKESHDSSIRRGLIKVKDVAVSAEEVWKHGISDNLFLEGERKRVYEWSEQMASQTYKERYEVAKYGKIYGDERRYESSGSRRDDVTEIWKRGYEYGLFLPSEKAAVLRIHYAGIGAASMLTQRIKMVDPKSPEANRLIDDIHDFTKNEAVVLLGPEVEKLLGPFGYQYSGNVDRYQVAFDINKAYEKSLQRGQIRKASNASLKERWDECLRRRSFGPNNLEQAKFDPVCFQSEEEFAQELSRRAQEFKKLYTDCGQSRPSHFKCRDDVADEYFPAGQARKDAIRRWALAELEVYQGVVQGGVVSQSGFHFAKDVLGWSTQRSAAFGGFLSNVASHGRAYVHRRAVLRQPPANVPQPPTPTTEIVKKEPPIPKPDQPGVRVTPKADPKATARQHMQEIEQAQQRYDRLKQKASQAEENYAKRLRPSATARQQKGQQLTQQETDLLSTKRSLAEQRDRAKAQLTEAKNKLSAVQPPAEGAPKHGAAGLAQEPKYLAEVVASGVPARLVDKGAPVIDAALVGKPELHSVKSIVPSPGADAAVRLADSNSPRDLATRIGGMVRKALMDRGSDKWNRLRNQWNTTKRSTYADQFGYELPKNRDEISFVVYVRVVTATPPSPAAQKAVETAVTQWLSKTQKVPPNFSWRVIYTAN